MNFKMGLSICEWDISLLVVKRESLLPVAIQLNIFSGPALEATDVVAVAVDDSWGPDRVSSFLRGEDNSVLFVCNGDTIMAIPP
jgi:hypothetical protein